jgi:hypothetical protein
VDGELFGRHFLRRLFGRQKAVGSDERKILGRLTNLLDDKSVNVFFADEAQMPITQACCKRADCALGKFRAFQLFYQVGKGAGFNRPPAASQTLAATARLRGQFHLN